MAAVHCTECGAVNAEGSNYCARCGAFIGAALEPEEGTTASYVVDQETGELTPVDLDRAVGHAGAVLRIKAGGGRVGETFELTGARHTIGRRPECDIFLDDVTVSRDHAVVVRRGAEWWLDDHGSLNGTYVNRDRVDSHRLESGDELQIGKYKLVFLAR